MNLKRISILLGYERVADIMHFLSCNLVQDQLASHFVYIGDHNLVRLLLLFTSEGSGSSCDAVSTKENHN
jgi:hypothetical protein